MLRIRSGNPALRRITNSDGVVYEGEAMTHKGVALKTVYFASMTIVSALAVFIGMTLAVNNDIDAFFSLLLILLIVSAVGAMVCALLCSFFINAVPVAGTLYAIFEGCLLGFISTILQWEYPGIAVQALVSTAAVFMAMSVLYYTGVIRVGSKFRRFMISALISIVVAQLVLLLLSFIVPANPIANAVYGNGYIGILFSVIMVVFASFMLLFDFSSIDMMVAGGLDKRYEWAGAFGLTVTLIWMYMEILRLLAKLNSRRR